MAIVQILFLLAFPLAALQLAARNKFFNIIGPVVLCYIGGILFTLIPGMDVATGISKTVSEAVIPLAIPLLLFSLNFMAWLRFARSAVISFSLALVSVVVMSIAGFYVLGGTVENPAEVSGMLIGVYTGGTPNMAALGTILGVPEDTYLLMQTSDVVLGGIYLLLLLSVGRRVARLFLRPFSDTAENAGNVGNAEPGLEEAAIAGLNWSDLPPILQAFGLSALIVVVSAGFGFGLSGLFGSKDIFVPLVMLGLTACAIFASFYAWVRGLRGSYESGEYLILIFCVAMGSLVNPASLFSAGQQFLVYCGFVMIGAIVLHMFLGWLFRLDADTMLVASTAAIYGPPFVPAICDALRNRQLLISGLTTGLVGYAVGTPLGWLVTKFLGG